MPTPTYDLIASSVVSSNASSITLNSISSSYRDLVLVCNIKATSTSVLTRLRFNGDSGSNYNGVYMWGASGTTSSGVYTNYPLIFLSQSEATSSQENLIVARIVDYAVTDKHKSIINRYNHPSMVQADVWRYASLSAISSLEVFEVGGATFAAGSSVYLYGIVG